MTDALPTAEVTAWLTACTVTVPGEGYKFTAKSQAVLPTEPATTAPSIAVVSMEARAEDATAFRPFPSRMAAIGAAAAALDWFPTALLV